MDCVMCGKRAGYNRAIIEVLSGQIVGKICRNCELDRFGDRFETYESSDDSCMFCTQEGYHTIPKFSANMVVKGEDLICENEINASESAPRLCDKHFEKIQHFQGSIQAPQSETEIITGG